MTSTSETLEMAKNQILGIVDKTTDLFSIKIPDDPEDTIPIEVISKLSPLVANIFEIWMAHMLNKPTSEWGGKWKRQDPDFPDIVLNGTIEPVPGIEMKTWFPFSTEMTARFKESQTHLSENNTLLAIICWIPEYILFGFPKVIDIWVGNALEVAVARNGHYYNPPDYILIEPEDTVMRTRNLQQRNVSGYKFQGTPQQLEEAERLVDEWENFNTYSLDPDKQFNISLLSDRFNYRNETNFSKLDRIKHEGIDEFISRTYRKMLFGSTIGEWKREYKRNRIDTARRLIEIAHREV